MPVSRFSAISHRRRAAKLQANGSRRPSVLGRSVLFPHRGSLTSRSSTSTQTARKIFSLGKPIAKFEQSSSKEIQGSEEENVVREASNRSGRWQRVLNLHLNPFRITNPNPRTQLSGTPMVYVKIRGGKYSKFFAAALGGRWTEFSTSCVDLSSLNPSTWPLFISVIENTAITEENEQLYLHNPIMTKKEKKECSTRNKYPRANQKVIQLGIVVISIDQMIQPYLFGEFLNAPAFCGRIIDLLIFQYLIFLGDNEETFPLWNLHLLFSGVPSSGLQRMVADMLYYHLSSAVMRWAVTDKFVSDDMLVEVAFSGLRSKNKQEDHGNNEPWSQDHCNYHEHDQGAFEFPCVHWEGTTHDQDLFLNWEDQFDWEAGRDWS